MKTLKETREPKTSPAEPRRVRPAVAFGAAAVLMVAAISAVVLVQGNEPKPADQPTIAATTSAPGTTVLETTTEGPVTSVATDGPTTQAPPVTTIPRKSMAEEVISLTGDSLGVMVSTAIDPAGHLVAAYWSGNDETLKVIRCADVGCAEAPEEFTLASYPRVTVENEELAGVGFIDLAVAADGAPIVIATTPFDWPTVHACADADCTTIESAELTAEGRINWPHMALAEDGTPRIAYFTADPSRDVGMLELAVCGDPVCSADQRTIISIDDNLLSHGEASIRIDPQGRILIGYESTPPGPTQARVAVCSDDTCSAGPTILTFDDAVGARTTAGSGGDFWVWYRSGPAYGPEGDLSETSVQAAWDLMVASCGDTGCALPSEVEVGWGMLVAWPADVRLVPLVDGTVVAGFNYWSSELCQAPFELRVLDPAAAEMGTQLGVYYLWGSTFDAVGTDRGVAAVFSGEEVGLEAVELTVGGPAPVQLAPVCEE